ncbi:MAG: glycoside hydrolase family 88 protein [Candidatus Ornithospirochaeta sp.]|nr:glycoside hydrolase family 88 protein [Candidatus Ornithospirochaeta sp.]
MWIAYFRQFADRVWPKWLNKQHWSYKHDLCSLGFNYLAQATGDSSWNSYVLDSARYLMDPDGTVIELFPDQSNIDKVSFGKTLRLLRDLTGDPRYVRAVNQVYGMLKDYPRTETGNFWHKNIYPDQLWLDGLYMGQPFYAACIAERNEDKWDDIIDQFESADKLLWNEEKGLYMHGIDCSRKMDWCDKETGLSPSVWLRAEGWYLMALCDVYEIARRHTERAKELIPILKKALDGIMKYQLEDSRMFLQVVDRADIEGNYPETSGSAMVAYSLMKGVRLGMLDEGCWEKGYDIIEGIRKTYLKEEDGILTLYGTCASAGLGPGPHNRPDRDGTAEYYIFREKQDPDNLHGTGAVMMAVSEALRRK